MTIVEKIPDTYINFDLLKQMFIKWQYVKIAVTLILIWYAYYQITRFNNAEGNTVEEIIKNQNKIKFQTKVLIGDGHGLCAYFSMLWSGTVVGLIIYLATKSNVKKS